MKSLGFLLAVVFALVLTVMVSQPVLAGSCDSVDSGTTVPDHCDMVLFAALAV